MSRTPLRIASYNVHRCVGTDGRKDPGRVADVLRELDADVIGLQEVESTHDGGPLCQLRDLADRLGAHAIPGPTLLDPRGNYGNALLTRLPPVSVRTLDLSVPKREARGLLDVEIDWHGEPVRVLTTHFGLSAAERRIQVMLVLGELHLHENRPTILVGDFNEWLPGSRPLRALQARFGGRRSPRTFPAWRPLLALDRIWMHPGERLVELRAHRSPLAHVSSDHLPIVAVVEPEPARPRAAGNGTRS